MARRTRDGLFKRGAVWWIRTDPVTRRAISTGCRDYHAATLVRAERERTAASPVHTAAPEATLGHWYQHFVADITGRKASGTVKFYATKLGHWARRLGADYSLALITPATVDQHVHDRRAEGASDPTIRHEIGALITMLGRAKRAECYFGDLTSLRPPDLKTSEPRERSLTEREVTGLLAELPPHRAAAVAILVGLGLRKAEAWRLRPSDVDLDRGTVRVGGTKTRKSRGQIPIVRRMRPLVEAALPYLPLEQWTDLYRGLDRACRRAGIERCTPNDLRRTTATLFRQAGIDADTARRLLRHTTTAMVERHYDQPSTEQLAERIERQAAGAPTLQLRDSADETGRIPRKKRHLDRTSYPSADRPYSGSLGGADRCFAYLADTNVSQAALSSAASVTLTRQCLARLALAEAAQRMRVLPC